MRNLSRTFGSRPKELQRAVKISVRLVFCVMTGSPTGAKTGDGKGAVSRGGGSSRPPPRRGEGSRARAPAFAAYADALRVCDLGQHLCRLEQLEPSDELCRSFRAAREALDANASLVALKRGDARLGLLHARRALELNPRNVKAAYRRGLAHKELGELEDALAAMGSAADLATDAETRASARR